MHTLLKSNMSTASLGLSLVLVHPAVGGRRRTRSSGEAMSPSQALGKKMRWNKPLVSSWNAQNNQQLLLGIKINHVDYLTKSAQLNRARQASGLIDNLGPDSCVPPLKHLGGCFISKQQTEGLIQLLIIVAKRYTQFKKVRVLYFHSSNKTMKCKSMKWTTDSPLTSKTCGNVLKTSVCLGLGDIERSSSSSQAHLLHHESEWQWS